MKLVNNFMFWDSVIDYKVVAGIERPSLEFQQAKYQLFMTIVMELKIDKLNYLLKIFLDKILW